MKSKILIIEEDEQIREVLHDVLEIEDYQVTSAKTGLMGLKHMEEGLIPDIILLDIYLPRLEEQHFMKLMQKQFPHICESIHVLFMTAASPVDIPDHYEKHKILHKPIEMESLLLKLNTLRKKK